VHLESDGKPESTGTMDARELLDAAMCPPCTPEADEKDYWEAVTPFGV
jgi:hypothetical protein